jgi:hypothetical protein
MNLFVLEVGTASDYGLGLLGFDSHKVQDISVLHSVQTGSATHSASNVMGTGALSPGVTRPVREADHSAPSSVEVKNGGAVPPLRRNHRPAFS